MVDQLTNYILQQISQRYKIDQIRSYLISQNYPLQNVEASVNEAIDISAKSYISYIDSQISAGYKISEIRLSLVNQGYDPTIVDYAANHYYKNFIGKTQETLKNIESKVETTIKNLATPKDVSSNDTVPGSQTEALDSLIKQNITAGLSLENIRSNLMQQGYDSATVNTEVNKFYHSHFHLSKQTTFAFIAIILAFLLAGGGIFLFNNSSLDTGDSLSSDGNLKSEQRLLDADVENAFPSQPMYSGDRLNFNIDIDNMGLQRDFDMILNYQVKDQSGKIVAKKKTTKSTASSLNDYISLSSVEPGIYTFNLEIEYSGEIPAEAAFDFAVQEEGTDIEAEVEDLPDEKPDGPTIVVPTSPEEDYSDISEITNYGYLNYLTISDEEELSKVLAEKGEAEAFYICRQSKNKIWENECEYFIALETNNSDSCDRLSDLPQDKCYLDYARDSDDDAICENLISTQAKSLCKMLVIQNKNAALSDSLGNPDYYNKIADLYSTPESDSSEIVSE